MTGGAKIAIRDLSKAFGDKVVLDGVNLDLAPGESLSVIGQSGSGKSVMLKCILGLVQPDSGSILIDGEDVVGASERDQERIRRKFGKIGRAHV